VGITVFARWGEIYSTQSTTLYIKVSRGYTPEGKTERKYYQSTKKGNLLLRMKRNKANHQS
jgi:hypothetical protein